MSYDKPSVIHNPATGGTAPATWGDGVNDCFDWLDAGHRIPLFPLSSGMPPLSGVNSAGYQLVESTDSGTAKPLFPVLTFDTSDDEGRIWAGEIPGLYGGTFVLKGQFYMPTATSGTVVFGAQLACWSDTDATVTSKAFATVNTTSAITVPGAALTIKSWTLTLANADSAVALDSFSLLLFRDVSEDTAAEDVYLKSLALYYSMVST